VGNDFYASNTQSVTIRLVPMGVILPPAGTPLAAFSFSPDPPEANTPVAFDASASCADASAATCSSDGLTYHWDFGDGRVGSGRTAAHVYGLARTHNVVLTVTNSRGRQASISKPITVGAGNDPSASFVYSPKPVVINSAVNFDASGSRPASGHLITGYKWNWGDGTSSSESSSPLASHTYTAQGSYTVVLTVTDESGQTGTKTESIDVGLGNPTANFTFIKSGLSVDFDGRSSVAVGAATISTYTWNFGDATTAGPSASPTTTHVYGGNGNYNVTLTVTDSTGKVGVVSKTVTLP
jgi:PKD repeat protein